MPTIKVTIDQFGQPTIEAEGFVGSKCELATASLEQTLRTGAAGVARKRKPEFYQQAAGKLTVTNR